MSDIYKENILPRLENSVIYKRLIEKIALNRALEGEVENTIHQAIEYAYNRAKLIIKYMPQYTLHDEEHLFKVLYLMGKLIPHDLLGKLDIPELMLLILSAFFHDLGMAPSQQDVDAWKGNFDKDSPSQEQLDKYKQFERFKSSYPDKNRTILSLKKAEKYNEAAVLEEIILVDFIRINHASKLREIIADEYTSEIKYKTTDLRAILIDICESHCMSPKNLLKFDSSYPCGDGEYACVPFVGALLRLADVLDFDTDRTPDVLFHTINISNLESLKEWEKHLAIQNWDISNDRVIFHAICEAPKIEYAIRSFCDEIDKELDSCRGILSNLKDHIRLDELSKYKIQLPLNVDRSKITAKKDLKSNRPIYRYNNIRFVLNKERIINLLMGNSLYGNSDVALRELLQNSIDTCLLRQAIYNKKEQPYTPKITVSLDTVKYQLTVSDNGRGMNEDDISDYYSNIGTSFYRSKEFFELQAENEIKFTSISRFGIGVLSCFMISDTIQLETRKFKGMYVTDEPIKVTIEGQNEIFYISDSNKNEPGTITTLELRSDNQWLYIGKEQFYKIVKDTLKYPPFEIEIIYNGEACTYNNKEILSMEPSTVLNRWWSNIENTKKYSLTIDNENLGIKGKADILLLEKEGLPVSSVQLPLTTLNINGKPFDIKADMGYEIGRIRNNKSNISVNQEGEPVVNDQNYIENESNSSFSIHGIEYSNTLFPTYNSKGARLKWPIPMLLVLNYGGCKDLDLNSARNEIIENDKWNEFERNLSYVIHREIRTLTSKEYLNELYDVLVGIKSMGYNDNFYIGLEKAKEEI